mmetsp:Transcript_5127/g.23072  ORF Transcript_5127/g.23072 Transcript_5127/m.23072 type:complete len:296 (-) Transcript_5127:1450-2337(-)
MDRALDTSTSVTTCVTGLLSHRLGLRSILRTSNCSRASAAYRLTHPNTKSQLPSELTSASPRLTMRPSAVFPGTLMLDRTSRSSRGARLAIAEAVPRVSSLSLTTSIEFRSELPVDAELLDAREDLRCWSTQLASRSLPPTSPPYLALNQVLFMALSDRRGVRTSVGDSGGIAAESPGELARLCFLSKSAPSDGDGRVVFSSAVSYSLPKSSIGTASGGPRSACTETGLPSNESVGPLLSLETLLTALLPFLDVDAICALARPSQKLLSSNAASSTACNDSLNAPPPLADERRSP